MIKNHQSRARIFLFVLVLLLPCQVFSNSRRIKLYMEDGQLYTHCIRVAVADIRITYDMDPKLYLQCKGKIKGFEPREVAPNQQWLEKGPDAKEGLQTGSVLLFELRGYSIPIYKSCSRIMPVLKWREPKTIKSGRVVSYREMQALSPREIVLGNPYGAVIWALLAIISFLLITSLLLRKSGKKLVEFVTLAGGRASLSLFQMALWTIVIGFTVLLFGIMRLQVPYIPDTLILLMGLSAGTSAAGHWQAHRMQEEIKKATGQEEAKDPKLGSMLTIFVKGKHILSFPKIQLLFWTAITIVLFIVKSFLEGQPWDIPPELVFLMGISQASFLGRNYMAIRETQDAENNNNATSTASASKQSQKKPTKKKAK
jgi:hypothetical protein